MTYRSLTLFLLAILAIGCGQPAWSASTTAPATPAPVAAPVAADAGAVTATQAQQALAVLQDAGKRDQLLQVLRTIANAAPAASPAVAPVVAGAATPAAPPAAAPAPAPAPAAAGAAPAAPAAAAAAPAKRVEIAPDSLGAEVVDRLSELGQTASDQLSRTTQAVTNFPALIGWIRFNLTDPAARAALGDATWRLLAVLAGSLVVERLLRLSLRRPSRALAERARTHRPPDHGPLRRRELAAAALRRVPLAIGNMLLDLADLCGHGTWSPPP